MKEYYTITAAILVCYCTLTPKVYDLDLSPCTLTFNDFVCGTSEFGFSMT